jgi:UDP-N-acetylmuramoyl-tripeptide--D-alanyl-D-alanine ligase
VAGLTHSTEGSLNNHLGVPITLTGLSDDHLFAVVEMGMNRFGEIARLAEWARPNAGIITHVGHAHLEGVGSFEGVCRAKAELAGALPPDGFLVLPAGVPALETALDEAGYTAPRLRFAIEGEADLVATDVTSLGPAGVSFRVEGELVRLRLAGVHNVMNALAALLCARELGVTVAESAPALARAAAEPGRMEIVTAGGVALLLDHYNANPESALAALSALRTWPASRRIAVFGDMCELGEYAAEGHRAVGQAAAFVNELYLVGDETAHVAQGAVASGLKEERVRGFTTHRELADALAPALAPGDAVLIKGSRAARMEAISEVLKARLSAAGRAEG